MSFVLRLDEKMHVIALDREMRDLELGTPIAANERILQNLETSRLPQMANLAPHANGHVNREPSFQNRSLLVRNERALVLAFGAGVAPFTTPGAEFESELLDLIGHCF